MVPLIISDTTKPLIWFGRTYVLQIINVIPVTVYVYITPRIISSIYYYPGLILILSLNELIKTLEFAAHVGFFAAITEPRIGGTYMTFLATLSNLGFAVNSSIILYAADWLPKKYTYVIASGTCGLLGILWFSLSYRILKRLQELPTHKWHLKKAINANPPMMPEERHQNDHQSSLISGD